LHEVISHGQPRSERAKPNREGPDWFQALNRNGDSDLSPREWIDEVDGFHMLTADNDRLLSEIEAKQLAL
jgi:hypothetical protein